MTSSVISYQLLGGARSQEPGARRRGESGGWVVRGVVEFVRGEGCAEGSPAPSGRMVPVLGGPGRRLFLACPSHWCLAHSGQREFGRKEGSDE